MKPPINLPGCTCSVIYPAGVFSLEHYEGMAYERFAFNTFRESVAGLARRGLPVELSVKFEESLNYPAWGINCWVSSLGASRNRFTIHAPELLPNSLALLAHTLGPIFENPLSAKVLNSTIQTLIDHLSVSARAYMNEGLGSAIRTGFQSASVSHDSFQKSADLMDRLIYLIVNHEIGHIYIGQMTRNEEPTDAKALEFLADFVAAEWLFRRYIFQTPDDLVYRKWRGVGSHAEAILQNAKDCLNSLALIYILMGLAGAQLSDGKFEVTGGPRHPGAFVRYTLQTDWVMGAVEAQQNDLFGVEGMKKLSSHRKELTGMIMDSGLVNRSAITQICDEEETKMLVRAAEIAEERKIEEVMLGLDFLRGSGARAAKMRAALRPA